MLYIHICALVGCNKKKHIQTILKLISITSEYCTDGVLVLTGWLTDWLTHWLTHSLTHSLTRLVEPRPSGEATQEVFLILWILTLQRRIHKNPMYVPVLCHLMQSTSFYSISLRFISILYSHLRVDLLSGPFASGCPSKLPSPRYMLSPSRVLLHVVLCESFIWCAWLFGVFSAFFTKYMDVNSKWPISVHWGIRYDSKTNKCTYVCMKIHYAHSIPPTCSGHLCDHPQGDELQWIHTQKYFISFWINTILIFKNNIGFIIHTKD